MQILNASRSQLEAKLGKTATAQIAHFQERGKPMTLSCGGWVAGDSNDGGDIINTPTARDLPNADDYEAETIAMLKQQQELYRSGIKAIDDYLARIAKGKVNPKGSTEPPRSISSNTTSKIPGPRGDLFDRNPDLLRGTIERMRASRQVEEEKLQLEKELAAEAKAWFDAKQELMSLQKRDWRAVNGTRTIGDCNQIDLYVQANKVRCREC